jgi:hypothetical protein
MHRALILLAFLLQEPAAEKIEIRVRPAEGDKLEITDSWTYTFRGLLGEEPLNTSSRGGRRLVVQMARVESGVLTRKVVQVADAYVESQDIQTGKFIRTDNAINGRTVTIERRGGGEVLAGVEGVPEAEQKTLAMDDPLTKLFPDHAVKVGETWEISGEGLKRIFTTGDFTEGRIEIALREIKEIEGRRCAVLVTKYKVAGKAPDGLQRTLELTGTLTVWIDRGYILAMSQSGRMTTSGADPKTGQPNGQAAVTGELKATLVGKPK